MQPKGYQHVVAWLMGLACVVLFWFNLRSDLPYDVSIALMVAGGWLVMFLGTTIGYLTMYLVDYCINKGE